MTKNNDGASVPEPSDIVEPPAFQRNHAECVGKWDTTHCDWQPLDGTPSIDRSLAAGTTANHCRRCDKRPENEERARVVNHCDELAAQHHADAERNASLVFSDGKSEEMVSRWIDEARARSSANRAAADILRTSGYLDAPAAGSEVGHG